MTHTQPANNNPPVLLPRRRRNKTRSTACLHCRGRVATCPRGLCTVCYYAPAVRERYPTTCPHLAEGVRESARQRNHSLPATPTTAPPGSPEKLAVLAERARLRQQLHHPADLRGAVRRRKDHDHVFRLLLPA